MKKKKLPMEEVKRQQRLQRQAEVSYQENLERARLKNEYIRNLIQGRYHLARCNTIAEQLNAKVISETFDGRVKTEEYMKAEYAMSKMQAIMCMRNVHFMKEDLMNKFKLTITDIEAIERDYYDGKIIREVYDEQYKKGNKAEFVKDSAGDKKS